MREMDEDDKSVEVVIESAKKLIIKGCYNEAKGCIKEAMVISPCLENIFGMLIISETLHYGNICFQNSEFDCFSVLHLHSSSTETEIKTRVEDLVNEIIHIKNFPGYFPALSLIHHSKSELCHKSLRSKFDEKRMNTIVFEWPISNKKASSFKDDYLNWRPTMYYDGKLHRTLPVVMNMGLSSSSSSSSPSQEFRKLMNHVFDKMPQRPHYEMLPKVFQGEILEGMKMVLDMGFVNLVEKIQKVNTLKEFSDKSEGFKKDLEQLSRMGYNVDKLNERIDELQRISEHGKAIRDATIKVEDECCNLRKRILECEDSIEMLNFERQYWHKESAEVLVEFESTTRSSLLE